tara:strand:- start:316 stop:927 length:612 start_codon:yes stop_codon:yes gene_type:complete
MQRRVISHELYQKLTALNWDNPHSKRLSKAVGDPHFKVAWVPWWELDHNPTRGCWVAGALRPVTVKRLAGSEERVAHQEDVIFPVGAIMDWDGGPTTPQIALSIVDPRVEPHLRSWDKSQQGTAMSFDDMQRHNAAQDEKVRDERYNAYLDMAKDLRNLARKQAGDPFFYGSMDVKQGPKKKAETTTYLVDKSGEVVVKGAPA